jgi:hypothetical protein
MLVRGVQFNGTLSFGLEGQRFRTDQRHIVKMHHVIRLAVQYFENTVSLEQGVTGLLGQKGRQPSVLGAQPVYGHVGMPRKSNLRLTRMQQMVSVSTVNHIHLVPGIAQGVRQSIDIHGIAAETVRRIKRCQMEEIEGPAHRVATRFKTAIS